MDYTESFLNFLHNCSPDNVREKLGKRYPGIEISLEEGPELPELVKHEVWCCECGCGEIQPVKIVDYSMFIMDKEGNVESIELESRWASPHMRNEGYEGLFVWNVKDDVEVCGKYVVGTC